jgi:hypothetical protein
VLGCSCGDRACAQAGKHPLGALVPHGLREATCNRARILAWWTQHPHANVGLATGHRFDVLDLDGPAGVAALREFADRHGTRLPASGPVVRTGRGRGSWHYYLAPAGLPRRHGLLDGVDYQALGAYVVAPPSRHATGQRYSWARDLAHPLPALPGALYARLAERAQPARPGPAGPPVRLDGPADPWARAALAAELGRVAGAGRGGRNRQLWESGRNLFNLVAAGALDAPRGRAGAPCGRRPLRPPPRGATADPPDARLRPAGRPGPPPPPARTHRPGARPRRCFAPARHPGGGRTHPRPRGEVMPTPQAPRPARATPPGW